MLTLLSSHKHAQVESALRAALEAIPVQQSAATADTVDGIATVLEQLAADFASPAFGQQRAAPAKGATREGRTK